MDIVVYLLLEWWCKLLFVLCTVIGELSTIVSCIVFSPDTWERRFWSKRCFRVALFLQLISYKSLSFSWHASKPMLQKINFYLWHVAPDLARQWKLGFIRKHGTSWRPAAHASIYMEKSINKITIWYFTSSLGLKLRSSGAPVQLT